MAEGIAAVKSTRAETIQVEYNLLTQEPAEEIFPLAQAANRSWSRRLVLPWRSANPAYWWVISGALGFLAAVLYIPSLSQLFRFTVLHADDLAVCFTAGAISFLLLEIIKRRGRKHLEPR